MDAYPITKFNELVIVPWFNPKTGKYDGKWWKTIVALEYMVDGEYVKIPPGYVTDLGSIPWYGRWLISSSDQSILAFVIHDLIYGKSGPKMSRKDADRTLRECSKAMKQESFKVKVVYVAIRIGGSKQFKSEDNIFDPVRNEMLAKIVDDNSYKLETV